MANDNYGEIGSFGGGNIRPVKRKYTIIQSLWTQPIKKERLRDTMFLCALSLAYAKRNGYKVRMHTDSKGFSLLKGFGYDRLYRTLDAIPDSVPTDLFAAGKFYAMKAEGVTGKVHIDVDVFIKKPYLIDFFYEDKTVDAICQMEEDMPLVDHSDKTFHMHVLGYPPTTRPNWVGSMNTGIVGFNNKELAEKYVNNYFSALKMYTAEKLDKYKQENGCKRLAFDFVLEQIELSYLSVGYNVYALLPTKNVRAAANILGYQHLQGGRKWSNEEQEKLKSLLIGIDRNLYLVAARAALNAMK